MDRAEIEKFIDGRIEENLKRLSAAHPQKRVSGRASTLKAKVSKHIREIALDAVLYATSQPKTEVAPTGPVQGYYNYEALGPAIDLGISLTEAQQGSINGFVTFWVERLDALLSAARRAATDKHQRLIDAQNVIRQCRAQFEFYRQQHLAKSPPDAAKAERNEILRNVCDTVLPEIVGIATRPDTHDIFVTDTFKDTLGDVRLSVWPEGLVFWVGGEICWRSWKDAA